MEGGFSQKVLRLDFDPSVWDDKSELRGFQTPTEDALRLTHMERGENFHLILQITHMDLQSQERRDNLETNNSSLTVISSAGQLLWEGKSSENNSLIWVTYSFDLFHHWKVLDNF